jgi:hypothetical protein
MRKYQEQAEMAGSMWKWPEACGNSSKNRQGLSCDLCKENPIILRTNGAEKYRNLLGYLYLARVFFGLT